MGSGMMQAYALGSKARSPHRAAGAFIASHIKDEAPETATYVGLDRLARMTGQWKSRASDSLKVLEDLGEIRVERRAGRTSLYRVEWSLLEWQNPVKDLQLDNPKVQWGRLIADLAEIEVPPMRTTGGRKWRGTTVGGSEMVPDSAGTGGNQSNPTTTVVDTQPPRRSRTPCNPR